MLRIAAGDFADPRVVALLTYHVSTARAATGAGSAHALDVTGLQTPDIEFWAAWEGEGASARLLGIAALRRLNDQQGEVKSMHTAAEARRQGAGRALVQHIVSSARAHGLTRLSLETGSWPYFAPARAFYASLGFAPCGPFGDYQPDPNSVFMSLDLGGDGAADQAPVM